MKPLKLPSKRLLVQRTGLPFYDTARLIGVAQLFFGTASASVTETGVGWIVKGTGVPDRPEPSRLWIGERLRWFERKPNNYSRLDKWSQMFTDPSTSKEAEARWRAILGYFASPFADSQMKKENTTGLMDAALALGARGLDLSRYGDFAAESGTPCQQPEAEILAALVGLSHAARVNNGMYLLPIFGDRGGSDPNDLEGGDPVVTACYWNFNRHYSHVGGEHVAATWAMLCMIESLFDQGLPVKDFAYNRVDRPIYHSGTLGANRLCVLWRQGFGEALGEIARFLQATQREKGGHVADLARALADYVFQSDPQGLERVVRLKARAMADDDNKAKLLLRKSNTGKGIVNMMDTNGIPDVPENLCRAVWQALDMPVRGDKGDKGWIGHYMKLENAGTAHRFIEEIERLISRARMKEREVFYRAESEEMPLPELIDKLRDPRTFRAFRAAFLLKVLQIPAFTAPSDKS